jgi:nucleoredoxin
MLCILVLTLPFFVRPAGAADEVLAAKIDADSQKAPEPKIDLNRDLANKLVRTDGMKFKPYHLSRAGKIDYFLVYFGAHWCPNCKKFTPKLTEFYRGQRSEHRNFEVIFVSADKDEEAMLHYMNGYKMPWPAVRFGENKHIESLRALAGRGFPCVALVDAGGKVLAHSYGKDGRGAYVGPLEPVEKLKEILDRRKPKTVIKSVARTGR